MAAPTIYTYSLIKALYDEGKDYIDAFWPLVLAAFPSSGGSVGLQALQEAVQKRFSLPIPINSLSVILTRAKRNGLVDQERRAYSLTPKGRELRGQVEEERDVQRRINELLDEARDFIRERRGVTLKRDELQDAIHELITANISLFADFVNPGESTSERPAFTEVQAGLLDYFSFIEEARPATFATFRDLMFGSILAATVYGPSLGEIGKRFERTIVFLDTNLLFFILGFHFEEFNRPARELFDLMKAAGPFEFRVFDFTIEEMVSVLRFYAIRQHDFVPHVMVDSILSSLKSKGWTTGDVQEFIASIEERLAELGIRVHPTDANLNSYTADPWARQCLSKYKPEQPRRGQNHDTAAIDFIRKLRGGKQARLIEDARVIFVTADLRLAKCNLEAMGHVDGGTISEVIPDRLMTTLLWLKNPERSADVPLRSIISMHSRDFLISQQTWSAFFGTLTEMIEKGRVGAEEASILIYDARLQDLLRTTESREIGEAWITRALEDARDRSEQAGKDRSATERARLESARADLAKKASEREQQLLDGFMQSVVGAKREIEDEARRRTEKTMTLIGVVVLVAVLAVSSALWILVEEVAGLLAFLVQIVGLAVGYFFDGKRLREKMFNRMFNSRYVEMLRASRLNRVASVAKKDESELPNDSN